MKSGPSKPAEDDRGQDRAEDGGKDGENDSGAAPVRGQPHHREDQEETQDGEVLVCCLAGDSDGQAIQDWNREHRASMQPSPGHQSAGSE